MRYAELHCKTNFSFLEGASHAWELVDRAAELGYEALAITDRNSLAGMVRAHTAAKEAGLKLIVGAEITPSDAPPVVLWAGDRGGYGQLCRLITVGRRRTEKGQCSLTFSDIAEHARGLLAGVSPVSSFVSKREDGALAKRCSIENALAQRELRPPELESPELRPPELQPHNFSADRACKPRLASPEQLGAYHDVFNDRCYLLAELHDQADDTRRLDRYVQLSQQSAIPLVAAGDVHFHVPARLPLQHVLTCIRHGVNLSAAGSRLFPNASRCLQPFERIAAKFADIPDAVRRTAEIAERCKFNMDQLRYEYPLELSPSGMTPIDYLKKLTWEGAHKRYPAGIPKKVRELISHELVLIEELKYEAFFLTVFDAVRFARLRGILCQGRGSAANSAVCYCLGVTSVDPDRTELLFERFISRERGEAPDIDVDFEHERREEVLQYLYQKYGRERAGIAATVIRYRMRSAVRDVGKSLGLSLDKIDALAKNVEGHARSSSGIEAICDAAGLAADSPLGQRFIYLVQELVGFPRHLSQHVGGMVMTRGPLCELVPIENAAMQDRTVVQWDKNDLEELGILKVDCLSLGMLTAIRKCFDLVHQQTGQRWTLASIPPEDSAVYDMVCQADTIGCFQIESRAQMSMLPRLRPRCFYDLVIEIAIVRPGPIQGGMVHPYLLRRAEEEKVTYPSEEIRKVLQKTLGVPVFQEQVMQLAVVAAGFTPGEADQLRRAMGAWQRKGDMERFRIKLMNGMRQRGLAGEFAEQVFRMIKGFGEYGFPESHSASFALLVYASAWLKRYYPAAFTAALLNSQPMGFYSPSQLIQDARRHDVTVRPIDVNASDWDCTLEDPSTIRLGFRLVKGMPKKAAAAISRCRGAVPFASMDDFVDRTKLQRSVVVRLTEANAFGSLEMSRRNAYWSVLNMEKSDHPRPLLEFGSDEAELTVPLPERSMWEEVCDDYAVTGLTLSKHPMSFLREKLVELAATTAEQLCELADKRLVRIAGLITVRQRPSTARGITFATMEDETGSANLVIYQQVWQRYASILRHSNLWLVIGNVQREGDIIHVVVRAARDFEPELQGLHAQSRDFQ